MTAPRNSRTTYLRAKASAKDSSLDHCFFPAPSAPVAARLPEGSHAASAHGTRANEPSGVASRRLTVRVRPCFVSALVKPGSVLSRVFHRSSATGDWRLIIQRPPNLPLCLRVSVVKNSVFSLPPRFRFPAFPLAGVGPHYLHFSAVHTPLRIAGLNSALPVRLPRRPETISNRPL